MKSKKGFTLIELVVVMAIIAVLSLVIIGAIMAARRASIETQNRGNARTIEVALEAVASKNGGSYCAAAVGAQPACTAAGATMKLADLAGVLDGGTGGTTTTYLSDASPITGGSCKDAAKTGTGGGIIDLKADSFIIYVADNACAATTSAYLEKLTH